MSWNGDSGIWRRLAFPGLRSAHRELLDQLHTEMARLTEEVVMKDGVVRHAIRGREEVGAELRAWREHNDATTDALIAAVQRLYDVLGMGEFPLTTGIEEGINAAILEIDTNWDEAGQGDW